MSPELDKNRSFRLKCGRVGVMFWRPHPSHPTLINPLMLGVSINGRQCQKITTRDLFYYECGCDITTSHGVQGMISYFPSEILYSQISHYLLIKAPTHPLSGWENTIKTHIKTPVILHTSPGLAKLVGSQCSPLSLVEVQRCFALIGWSWS